MSIVTNYVHQKKDHKPLTIEQVENAVIFIEKKTEEL